jgi:DNA-binding response OmpR family regulator
MRIIVADDDPKLNGLICKALKDAGYKPDPALTATEARQKIRKEDYDLAIIDWIFDGEKIDGKDLIEESARKKRIPTLMLTGKTSLVDRIAGFDAGADDYLTKPFYLPELVARIKALLRRERRNSVNNRIVAGPLSLDPNSLEVTINRKTVKLRKKAFNILYVLVEREGKTMSRSALSQQVWEEEEGTLISNSIDVHMKSLRDKLGQYGRMIQTVRGVGYRFNQNA